MMALIVAIALLLAASVADARSSSHHSTTHRHTTTGTHKSSSRAPRSTYHAARTSRRAAGVARNSHGRIQRSAAARDSFKRQHPCPSTGRSTDSCPGYVIDHVKALKHGGADTPANMQWQTTAAAKAKDKVE